MNASQIYKTTSTKRIMHFCVTQKGNLVISLPCTATERVELRQKLRSEGQVWNKEYFDHQN
jgi:hypothetical protein